MARLGKQEEALQAQLKTATIELFGEPRMDAKAVTAQVNELGRRIRPIRGHRLAPGG